MELNALFLNVCGDVAKTQLPPPDQYAVLRASGSIRMLLLDADPLAHQVNRLHRTGKLIFDVLDPDMDSVPVDVYVHLVTGLSPQLWKNAPAERRKQLTLKNFLQIRCARIESSYFTIHELIDYTAHIAGGVHFGTATTDQERQLRRLAQFVEIVGIDAVTYFMIDIGSVVLEALRPLMIAALTATESPTAPPDNNQHT